MYTNLSLYYLNLLGITPWVTKKPQDDSKPIKLFIWLDKSSNIKVDQLIQHITHYLAISTHEYQILEGSLPKCMHEKTASSPLALLALGKDASAMDLNCPLFAFESAENLLNQPLKKKTLFKMLQQLKLLITA